MEGSRRVASLAALGGAIGVLAVEALYLSLITQQRATAPGGRVSFVVAWITVAALLAGVGAFSAGSARRGVLLGCSAAALLVLSVPAAFSIGIPLLICAGAIGVGALRAAQQLQIRGRYALLASILLIAVAAAALAVGFLVTES